MESEVELLKHWAGEYNEATKKSDPLRIATLKSLRNLSIKQGQSSLAKKLGVTPQLLNDVIHERRNLSDGLIGKILENL